MTVFIILAIVTAFVALTCFAFRRMFSIADKASEKFIAEDKDGTIAASRISLHKNNAA
jgi:hypothetical protein